MSRPPLGALRVFEAVARNGGFGRAADELCVTQSAVSHQVRALEDWLGSALFARSGNGGHRGTAARKSSRTGLKMSINTTS